MNAEVAALLGRDDARLEGVQGRDLEAFESWHKVARFDPRAVVGINKHECERAAVAFGERAAMVPECEETLDVPNLEKVA